MAQALDLPASDFEHGAHIEFSGNREVIIEGCYGIINYTQSEIKLNLGKCLLKFTGEGLFMRSMSENSAHVSGRIFSMEFCS